MNFKMYCQAKLSEDFLRSIKYQKRTACKRQAIYTLDGKPLCKIHAGLTLVSKAIAEGKLKAFKEAR